MTLCFIAFIIFKKSSESQSIFAIACWCTLRRRTESILPVTANFLLRIQIHFVSLRFFHLRSHRGICFSRNSRERNIVEFVTISGSAFSFWHGKYDWICKVLGRRVFVSEVMIHQAEWKQITQLKRHKALRATMKNSFRKSFTVLWNTNLKNDAIV